MKELQDWTLKEMKEYCSKHSSCGICPLNNNKFCDRVGIIPPEQWYLEEEKDTEQN